MTTCHPPRRTSRSKRLATLTAAVALGIGVAACGSDDSSGNDADAIVITDAWTRPSPMVANAAAVYLTITNNSDEDDELESASVDESVAAKVELHESRAAGADMTDDTAMTGDTTAPMMEMVPVDEIDVPAGGSVALQPGGLHIMLLELAEPLENGDEVELTLTFEDSGDQTVTAVVGDSAP